MCGKSGISRKNPGLRFLDQAETKTSHSLHHKEIIPFEGGFCLVYPLQNVLFDMAGYFGMAFDFKCQALFFIVLGFAPEAHRAPVDASSPRKAHGQKNPAFIAVLSNLLEPVFRRNPNLLLFHRFSPPFFIEVNLECFLISSYNALFVAKLPYRHSYVKNKMKRNISAWAGVFIPEESIFPWKKELPRCRASRAG